MKCILRAYGTGMSASERQVARSNAIQQTQTRGTSQKPMPPRNVICQPGPRGLLVTWNLPNAFNIDIQKWRVYKDNESTLFSEISDRGTRQCFIEATAGSAPPVVNVFVSSLNALGVESQKVQSQGAALTESGAPPMPNVPPGYNSGGAGGGNTGTGYTPQRGITA